jgi:hypothetical protein
MAVTKVKSKSKTKSKSKKFAKNGKNKTMKKNINKTMRGGSPLSEWIIKRLTRKPTSFVDPTVTGRKTITKAEKQNAKQRILSLASMDIPEPKPEPQKTPKSNYNTGFKSVPFKAKKVRYLFKSI